MQRNQPMKFSVTIPAYKSRYLDDAIKSVLAQSYPDWELIVVDDCSPENLADIVQPYLTDSRVHYYRNDKNCGAENVVDNWNICLSYCTGDYVISIGDDDRLLPCCLSEYAKLIGEIPGLHIYHAWTEIIDENGVIRDLQGPRPIWESALSLLWNRWRNRNKQFIGDFCYETSCLIAEGGYYKLPLAWCSDDITAVRAARDGGVANTQVPCFQYRDNGQTITNSTRYSEMKIEATLKAYEWYQQFLAQLSEEQLPLLDTHYLKTIDQHRQAYFQRSFGKDCSDAVKGNPFKLLHYHRLLRSFHFSKLLFLKWYLRSLLNLFK